MADVIITNTEPEAAPLVAEKKGIPKVQKGNPCLNGVVLLIGYTFSIILLIQGGIHMKECPANRKLPIIMVALGACFLVPRLLMCLFDYKSVFGDEDEYDVPRGLRIVNTLSKLVVIALFITLCVYSLRLDATTKPEDQDLPNYCDRALYLSGYWVSIVFLSLCGMVLIINCFYYLIIYLYMNK